MDVVVVSIGGSVLIPDDDDFEYLSGLAEMLIGLSKRIRLYIVVGGGRISRYYIKLGRKFGVDEQILDEMGVGVTRLNARLLILALSGNSNDYPATSVAEAVVIARDHPIVVMGGTTPGHTTDGVAASVAEFAEADRIVNATSVDGVYTKDPNRYDDAEKIEEMSFEELLECCKTSDWKAGPNNVFDAMGAEIIAKNEIPLLVVKGRDLDALKSAIKGRSFNGTTVGKVR
jgi:uridylate kinase